MLPEKKLLSPIFYISPNAITVKSALRSLPSMDFTHLPPEIKWEIAFHLSSYKDLIALAQVNRQLRKIFGSQALECVHINSQPCAGLTPLVEASILGDKRRVSTLLQKWAVVDLPDSLGRTPLSWASGSGHKQFVLRLP